MSDLNSKWAKLTGQRVRDWESNEFKLDLSFLSEVDLAAIASDLAGTVSEDFYSRPEKDQDPYIFYGMLLKLENSTIMQSVLKTKGV